MFIVAALFAYLGFKFNDILKSNRLAQSENKLVEIGINDLIRNKVFDQKIGKIFDDFNKRFEVESNIIKLEAEQMKETEKLLKKLYEDISKSDQELECLEKMLKYHTQELEDKEADHKEIDMYINLLCKHWEVFKDREPMIESQLWGRGLEPGGLDAYFRKIVTDYYNDYGDICSEDYILGYIMVDVGLAPKYINSIPNL